MHIQGESNVEATLTEHGYGGVHLVRLGGAITLSAGLPATAEALELLERAFEEAAQLEGGLVRTRQPR